MVHNFLIRFFVATVKKLKKNAHNKFLLRPCTKKVATDSKKCYHQRLKFVTINFFLQKTPKIKKIHPYTKKVANVPQMSQRYRKCCSHLIRRGTRESGPLDRGNRTARA